MKWKIETRKINEIIPNSKNPRKLSKRNAEELRKSLEKFGVCQPIVINTNNSIIGGHQRVRILSELGEKTVDVYVPLQPLSQKEEEELCIRLNKNNGDFDFDILANNWDPEELVEWGFTFEELHLEELPGSEGDEEKKQTQSCTMNITFMDAAHLQEAENTIATIVDSYPGSHYKVKIK